MEMYGPDYIKYFKELSDKNAAWTTLARAFWRELESRNPSE